MKTYNSPMLQVVSINKKDIIATSLGLHNDVGYGSFAPDQRGFDDWYEGY